MKILIVEDEPDIANAIARLLAKEGFVCDCVDYLDLAKESVLSYNFDAILLDRRLPDGDGLELIQFCKSKGIAQRFLLLSAMADLENRVSGLDSGADDYLIKPFEPRELLARVRAVLRRPSFAAPDEIVVGKLTFDRKNRNVFVGGRPLILARKELMLLEVLIRATGRIVERDHLIARAYGMDDEIQNTAIESHLSRLRNKLASAKAGVSIHAVRGIGYFLQAEDDTE